MKDMQQKFLSVNERALYVTIALLPFSPFLVTLFGTALNNIIVLSIWKEAVICFVFCLLVMYGFKQQKNSMHHLMHDPLVAVIFVYMCYMVMDMLVRGVTLDQLAGFVINSRFLLAFLAGCLLVRFYEKTSVKALNKLILSCSFVVMGIGLLIFFLPNNLLELVGYDPIGIDRVGVPGSVYYVSDGLRIERIQSTMRSPNSVGLYLLIPLALLLFNTIKLKSSTRKVLIGLCIIVIIMTFSRTALLGVFVVVAGYLFYTVRKFDKKKLAGNVTASLLAVAVLVVAAFSDPSFRELALHQTATQINGSTNVRLESYGKIANAVVASPFGYGGGSASAAGRLRPQGAIAVPENYYLQIMYEYGFVGFTLFIAILIFSIKKLMSDKTDQDRALLVSFLALLACSLFLPAWAEEAVSITWWYLFGLVAMRNIPVMR